MKLVRGLAVLGLAGFLVALPGWWPTSEEPGWQGYIEAEFVDVAAEESARLVSLSVERGDRVAEGQPLFRLDAADAAAARDEAAARWHVAGAELADLLTGQRSEEIAAIKAQREAAAATLEAAREAYERQSTLVQRAVASDASFEAARERYRVAQARIIEIEHQLALARLPARADRVEAARRNAEAARAALQRAEARLSRLAAAAPVPARVEDIFFRHGELVPAGRPVVRLLPRGNLKARFFVPQFELGRIAVGDRVSMTCDGCPEPVEARITFIAEEAEFTPPVIFSVRARQKLVYLVEARPLAPNGLEVGQPVDVSLAAHREARR